MKPDALAIRLGLIIAIISIGSVVWARSSTNYTIISEATTQGGGMHASTDYETYDAVGEIVVGRTWTGQNYTNIPGIDTAALWLDPTPDPTLEYDFYSDEQGWEFKGNIGYFDSSLSAAANGVVGLCPDGSTNCFSSWESPNMTVEGTNLYRSKWYIGSTSSNADNTVGFRVRVNQKGRWLSWERIVKSNLSAAPSEVDPKVYYVVFDPKVTGEGDNKVYFSFDILSFDPDDIPLFSEQSATCLFDKCKCLWQNIIERFTLLDPFLQFLRGLQNIDILEFFINRIDILDRGPEFFHVTFSLGTEYFTQYF